jgi:hypothetical protein
MKEFADLELPQRETVVYGYQSLDEESSHPVFPPVHHWSIIARIYRNLGLERKRVLSQDPALPVEPGGQPPETPRFDLTTRMVSALGSGLIEVTSYGPGIEQEVKNKVRGLFREGIAVIYLNLPIGDPQTAVLCQRFEELGFFFSGIQPRPDGMDLLCLQALNGPSIDYDLVQIHSDFGKELLGYVRKQDPLS